MPITTRAEFEARLADVNLGIQEITDYLNAQNSNDGLIRFPSGYIRECALRRTEYAFIESYNLKCNIAYNLMALDVVIWLNNRSTLQGQAMSMLLKVGLILVTSVVEALIKFQQRDVEWPKKIRKKVKYEHRIQRLLSDEIVTNELAQDLRWLWERRQNVHLYRITGREFMEYTPTEVARAMAVCSDLRDALSQHARAA